MVKARAPEAQANATSRAAKGAAQQQGVHPAGAAKPAQSRASRGLKQPAAVPQKKVKRATRARAPAAKASAAKAAAAFQRQKRGTGRPCKVAPAAAKAVRPHGGVSKGLALRKRRGIAEEQAGRQPASAGLPAAAQPRSRQPSSSSCLAAELLPPLAGRGVAASARPSPLQQQMLGRERGWLLSPASAHALSHPNPACPAPLAPVHGWRTASAAHLLLAGAKKYGHAGSSA